MVASPVVDLMPLVEKYKPTSTQKIIGQQGASSCVNKLSTWLGNWYKNLDTKPIPGRFGSGEGAGFRAALLSGPPGVGKTTSAHLVCKEAGFSFVEFNASDTRNKSSLENEVRSLLANSTLHDFSSGGSGLTTRHVLIMDEVDGMAGNEDRGGIAELIQLIKKTQIPIICICNDRNHQKVRNLANYCFDLRFYRPRVEQIKGAMMSVCYKEGIKIGNDELTKLIVSSNQDVRQVLHHLSLLCTKSKGKSAPMEQHGTIKDVRFNLFDALVKLFTYDENKPLSFSDRSDLFFTDYSMIPLFVYENYPNAHPLDVSRSKANTKKRLELGAKAMASIAFGNLIENEIRSTNNWSLLPLQAAFAAVLPSYYLGGSPGGRPEFPKFLGKQSTIGKNDRLLKELKMHMSLRVNNGKSDLNMDYVPALLNKIYKPLKKRGTDAVSQVLETMNYYSLRKEDLDTMLEFIWSNQKNPASELDSKIKSALTRACNSKGEMLPYTTIVGKKSKKRTIAEMSGTDDEEEEEEEEEILIKPKKVIKKEASSKADDESTAKSKAKQTKGTKRSRSPSKTRGGGTRGRGRKK